jgi:hypothetical protein
MMGVFLRPFDQCICSAFTSYGPGLDTDKGKQKWPAIFYVLKKVVKTRFIKYLQGLRSWSREV